MALAGCTLAVARAGLLACALSATLTACRPVEPDPSVQNPAPRGPYKGTRPAQTPPANADPAEVLDESWRDIPAERTQGAPSARPYEGELAAVEDEKPRDYSAELTSAARGAVACVGPRPASAAMPTEALVSLQAHVLESGAVSRAYARCAHLLPAELDCIRKHVEASRLAPAVQDAPRRIDASLKLSFRSAQANGASAPTTAPAAASNNTAPNDALPPGSTPPAEVLPFPATIVPHDPASGVDPASEVIPGEITPIEVIPIPIEPAPSED